MTDIRLEMQKGNPNTAKVFFDGVEQTHIKSIDIRIDAEQALAVCTMHVTQLDVQLTETQVVVSNRAAPPQTLEQRVAELEKHSHVPVTFVEDENGFLKVDK